MIIILTGTIFSFFSLDFIVGSLGGVSLKTGILHSGISIILFYGVWTLYSFLVSKYSKQKLKDVLNKDAQSFIPLFILILFPMKNLVQLGDKFSSFSRLPSALLFMFAFSFFIFIKIVSLKKIKPVKINLKYILILAAIYFIIFSTLSILKHISFNSTGYDLGVYDQVMYGYAKGKILDSIVTFPLLGMHVQPILFLILPFYKLFPTPITLLIIQTLFISLSTIPLYLLCKKTIKNEFASFLICIAYLLHPTIQYANLFDFHPIVLGLPFVIFSLYFFDKKNYKLGIFFLFLTALCKEYLTLLFVTFGIYLFFLHKKRALGSIMALIGIAWFTINYSIIMPHFYDAPNFFLDTNPYFGTTLSEVIGTVLFKPIYTIKFILTIEKLAFILLLLAPLALILPFFSPQILFLVITELALVLFYNQISIQQIVYHHPIIIVPFLYIASVFSIRLISKKIKMKNIILALSLLVFLCSLFSNIIYGPFAILYDIKEFNINNEYVKTGSKFVSMIPEKASVAAPNWILPHVSGREEVYALSHVLKDTQKKYESGIIPYPDYIIIDFSEALIDPKRSGRKLQQEQINILLNDKKYSIVEVEGTWVLFQKGEDYQENICKIMPFLNKEEYVYLNMTIEDQSIKKC